MGKALLHLREIRQGTHTEATGDDELGADIVFDVDVAGSLVAVGQIAKVKTPAGASSDMTFEVTLAADFVPECGASSQRGHGTQPLRAARSL